MLNQRLQFEVDRNLIGTGTNSNFNSFKIFGSTTATNENNLEFQQLMIQQKR